MAGRNGAPRIAKTGCRQQTRKSAAGHRSACARRYAAGCRPADAQHLGPEWLLQRQHAARWQYGADRLRRHRIGASLALLRTPGQAEAGHDQLSAPDHGCRGQAVFLWHTERGSVTGDIPMAGHAGCAAEPRSAGGRSDVSAGGGTEDALPSRFQLKCVFRRYSAGSAQLLRLSGLEPVIPPELQRTGLAGSDCE